MRTKLDLAQPRIHVYLKSTSYTRWIIIAIVAGSFWSIPNVNHMLIAILLSAAVIYNIGMHFNAQLDLRIFTNRALMIFVDGFMAILLIALTGYTASPYLFTLIFMIISAAFWYGTRAIILIAIMQADVLVGLEIINNKTLGAKNLLIQTLVVVTVGVYVSWLTKYERLERNELLRIGKETEKERQRLSALINSVHDSVLVLDKHGKIAIHNQAAADLVGGKKEIKGKPFDELLHIVDDQGAAVDFKIKKNMAPVQKEIQLRAADNSIVHMDLSVAPYIVDKEDRGNVIVLHDKSEDKTIAQEREEFIAVASHELRTPLAIAESDISTLLTPTFLPPNKESVNMLNSALRSLTQLSHIISDLTNLSQVENEKLEVDLEPLNPIVLLHEFQTDYQDQAKAKGLEMVVGDVNNVDAPSILTSRYVVREILTILISNAIKFADEGTITLTLVQSSENEGVTFAIKDSGLGISQSDQKKIFEKFFQSEHYSNRVHGGTGLGLYIAKQLAERITAKIWFDSELDKGSTFYLWVPPYSQHAQDKAKVAPAEIKDFFNRV